MKASDNTFPKLKLAEGAAPATPAAGQVVVYAKSDGAVYSKDDTGTETALGVGGGGGTPDDNSVTTAKIVDGAVTADKLASDVAELIRDTIGSALVPGSGITVTVNDAGDTITIASTGGYTDEQAQDAMAAAFAAGTHSGISFAYDDAGNRISATVTVTGGVPPVATISTATHNLVAANVGKYNRTTYAGAAAVTVQTNAAEAIPVDAEVHFRAVGGALTLTPASGVTLNAPAGGTLVVPQRGTVTIKKVATNEWDVFGVTEAAP